jgi:LDH2 family malate/lactate/ureidoglycolate dehydrogenase
MNEQPTPATISAHALRGWIVDVLVAEGMAAEHAVLAADALVDANLRGIDTHGVKQLRSYLTLARRGGLRVRPDIGINFTGSMMTVTADHGFGHVVGTLAMDRAIVLAREQGCAIGTIHEVGHLGALGYFTRRAAHAGMAAMLVQNGPPLMGPPGSARRAIGNNPLSFAAPVANRAPIVFDMAASESSFGKIIEAGEQGAALPAGWALDHAGAPTQDPRAALNGILLPIAGVKGIGLAMMVQCFAGSLSGTVPVWGEGIFGGFLMVVNPAMTVGAEAFAADMHAWIEHYTGSVPQGRVPGDRADAYHAERLAAGIPLPAALLAQLREDGAGAGVTFPDIA